MLDVMKKRYFQPLLSASRCFLVALVACLTILGTSLHAQGLLEDIDPSAKVKDVIAEMEAALSRLMTQFGDTLDEQTLLMLNRASFAIQSAKLASEDVVESTFGEVSEERMALVSEAHALVGQAGEILEGRANDLSQVEQRFSKTLEDVARVNAKPWVMSYQPLMYIPSAKSNLRLVINGKNLAHPSNRLLIAGDEIKPSRVLANTLEFSVPRNLFQEDEDGYARFYLRAYHDDKSGWFPFRKTTQVVREYALDLRSAGESLGSYVLETNVKKEGYWEIPDPLPELTVDTPVYRPHDCIYPPEGGAFDPASTEMKILINELYQEAHEDSIGGPFGVEVYFPIPAKTLPGPINAAALSDNFPEKICVTFHSPANPAAHIVSTKVQVQLKVRQRHPSSEEKYSTSGQISWAGGDVVEVLPAGHQGFRATVRYYAGGEDAPRVFVREESDQFLQVVYDPNTRSVIFRPVIK